MSFNLNNIEKLASAIAAAIPTPNSELKGEVKKNLKPILSSASEENGSCHPRRFRVTKINTQKDTTKIRES